MDRKEKVEKLSNIVGKIASMFIASAIILWGWNIVAPHLNAPLFSYWEIFAMRWALTQIANAFHK